MQIILGWDRGARLHGALRRLAGQKWTDDLVLALVVVVVTIVVRILKPRFLLLRPAHLEVAGRGCGCGCCYCRRCGRTLLADA